MLVIGNSRNIANALLPWNRDVSGGWEDMC